MSLPENAEHAGDLDVDARELDGGRRLVRLPQRPLQEPAAAGALYRRLHHDTGQAHRKMDRLTHNFNFSTNF